MMIKKPYLSFLLSFCFILFYGQQQELHKTIISEKKYDKSDHNFNMFRYHNLSILKTPQGYYIPQLTLKKDKESNENKATFRIGATSLLIIILLMTVFTYYSGQNTHYYRRQSMYRIRFKMLLKEKDIEKKQLLAKSKITIIEDLNISKKAINKITEKLKVFISEQQFLDNDLSLYNLAKAMETNPAYLSKVINFYEQKNFSTYITELRINYAVEALKTDATFRKYTIKAIAKEIGFNNEQSFSKAFCKKTGLYPSYFIKKLEQQRFKQQSV